MDNNQREKLLRLEIEATANKYQQVNNDTMLQKEEKDPKLNAIKNKKFNRNKALNEIQQPKDVAQ
eukprot:scaffold220_cov169-Amphora_coffeaeformis.AAC.14